MFICGRQEMPRCHVCGYAADYLCDWPITKTGRLCSAPMCEEHRHNAGPGRDYCGPHMDAAKHEGLTPPLPFAETSL